MLAVRRRPDDCSCLSLLGTARGDTWWQVSEASWDRPRETGPGFRRESHSWPAIARRFGVNGVVRNLACTRDCVRARQLSAVAVVTISFLSRWELRGRCATKSRASDPRTWKIFVRRSTSESPAVLQRFNTVKTRNKFIELWRISSEVLNNGIETILSDFREHRFY